VSCEEDIPPPEMPTAYDGGGRRIAISLPAVYDAGQDRDQDPQPFQDFVTVIESRRRKAGAVHPVIPQNVTLLFPGWA
jgi:hypothetical protein